VPAVLPRLAPLRVVLAVPFRATAAPEDGEVAVRVVWPVPAPATDTTGGTTTDAPATDAPLSGPHEQAAGVETDPDVLAAPPADED
jgi:hypothetical protein